VKLGGNDMVENKEVLSTESFDLIKKFTEAQGTSGFEGRIRALLREEITPLVDEVVQDNLGGLFGIKKASVDESDAPRIMFAAHMDEVGFIVTGITKQGLFRVTPLGGWNPYVVSSQRFTLQTKSGDYPIISSSIPPHLLRGTAGQGKLNVDDILFDGGFTSRDEAATYGVRIGDPIVPVNQTTKTANGKRIISKSWDNRYGNVALIEALRAVKDEQLKSTIIAGANVQEEVGLRGARVATHKFDPELFFAVDCSAADDLTGDPDKFGHLDHGFLLRVQDPTMITLPAMKEFLLDTAETNHIPYQYFVSKGGTDAGQAHLSNNGIPSAVIGVCGRYIHTHQTLFSIADYEAAKAMIIAVMKTLDRSTVNTIIKGV